MATRPSFVATPPPVAEGGGPTDAENALSPRQSQILDLLRQGKANKEIASQLGIGVGTVKQHVVALFKKLNVTNRAMAVSRAPAAPASGGPASRQAEAAALDLTPGCVLERRLSVVLTLEEGGPASDAPAHSPGNDILLRRLVGPLAVDYNAVLVTRGDHAVDLVFGVHCVRNDDARRALRVARDLMRVAAERAPGMVPRLRGALTAGLSLTSMTPTGGWTGELLASAAMGQARDLAAAAAPGCLVLGEGALELLTSGRAAANIMPLLHLDTLDAVPPPVPLHPACGVVGRAADLAAFEARLGGLSSSGGLMVFSGDGGMGKSMLTNAFADRATERGVPVAAWTVLPPDLPGAEGGVVADAAGREEALARLSDVPGGSVCLIDDAHNMTAQALGTLLAAWQAAQWPGLVVLAGRPGATLNALAGALASALPQGTEVRRLGHLDHPAQRALIDSFALRPEAAQAVADMAGGVPLFAAELARAAQAGAPLVPPPPLLMAVIQGRLEKMQLDRRILARVCRQAHGATVAEATLGLESADPAQAVARLIASGVVRQQDGDRQADARLRIPHPLLRAVLDAVLVD